MTKALLIHKAEQAADASAKAAVSAAIFAQCGCAFEAECMEARANRLAAMADDYRKAARVAR